MRLHSPPNVKLRPLLTDKLQDRETMENSPKIYNLIRSNLLLDREFVALMRDIQLKSTKINELMTALKEPQTPLTLTVGSPKQRPLAIAQWQAHRLLRNWMTLRPSSRNRPFPRTRQEVEKWLAEYSSRQLKGTVAAIKRELPPIGWTGGGAK